LSSTSGPDSEASTVLLDEPQRPPIITAAFINALLNDDDDDDNDADTDTADENDKDNNNADKNN